MKNKQQSVSILATFGSILLRAIGSGIGFSIVLVAIVFVLVPPVQAASEATPALAEVGLGQVKQGSLLFKTDKGGSYLDAPTLHSDVSIDVTAMVARVTVKQRFINSTQSWVEGVYVFPLPETAAVDHMRLQIGERVIEGKIKIKEEAKRIYQEAKQQGKKASLLEQERPNLFTTSVANIGPDEVISVEIEFQQQVHYDQGQFSLRFPMTMTPRYIPGQVQVIEEEIAFSQGSGWSLDTDQVPDASRITPPVHVGEEEINTMSLRVNVNAGVPLDRVESLYHPIDKQYVDEGHVIVNLAARVRSDRDFELRWLPQAAAIPRAAHFIEAKGEDSYHLVMILPPSDQSATVVSQLPKEMIFVIDTSGSMEGESIRQAKQALLMAVDQLRADDQFNIIQFNSMTSSLYTQSRLASVQNVKNAKRYINNLTAGGGTEIYPALNAALLYTGETESIRQVVFITDGSVGNEEQLFTLIKSQLGESRLFTVGIGSAPNSFFMSKAAQFGRGTFTYIGSTNEVAEKMGGLFAKLSRPVMTDLKVNWTNNNAVEMWPSRLADVYMGEPVVFVARSSEKQRKLEISGVRKDVNWSANFPLTSAKQGQGLGVLWARSKIASLMDSRAEGVSESEIKKSVTEVALSHHLVSKYTSLVAVDVTPTRPSDVELKQKLLANNLPHGSMPTMQLTKLASTATAGELNFIIGFVLLLLSALVLFVSDRLVLGQAKITRLNPVVSLIKIRLPGRG